MMTISDVFFHSAVYRRPCAIEHKAAFLLIIDPGFPIRSGAKNQKSDSIELIVAIQRRF